MTRESPPTPARGTILIVALGLLTLMSVFAVAFASVASLERTAASNHHLKVRARLVAESGIARAIAQLKRTVRERPWTDATPSGDRWLYRDDPGAGGGGINDGLGHGVPLREADETDSVEMSFETTLAHGPGSGTLAGVFGDPGGPARPGTFGVDDGDYYLLKVLDASSQINVNDDNDNLERMLTALGEAIAAWDEGDEDDPTPNPMTAEVVRRIIGGRTDREQEAYRSEEELRPFFENDEDFEQVRDHITVHSWRDRRTVTNEADTADWPPTYQDLAYRARSPVNVNTASGPVLEALCSGLEGQVVVTRSTGGGGGGALFSLGGGAETVRFDYESASIPAARAREIAIALVDHRRFGGVFRNESDLATFIREDLVDPGILSPAQGELLLANFSTDLRLRGFYQDAPRDSWATEGTAEKAHLSRHSTELCYGPTGTFEIEAIGRILAGEDEVAAEARVVQVRTLWIPLRITTQADFDRALRAAGSGAVSTLYETHPEPLHLPDRDPCPWDGHLQLSTREASRYPDDADDLIHATFNDGIDSRPGPAILDHRKETNRPLTPLLEGGTLASDGLLTYRNPGLVPENDREDDPNPPPEYRLERDVFPDNDEWWKEGSAQLWYKPAVDPSEGTNEVIAYVTVEFPDGERPREADHGGDEYDFFLDDDDQVDMDIPEGVTPPDVQSTPPDHFEQAQRVGVTWRLERFGTQLVSTRFIWGYPNGTRTPYYETGPDRGRSQGFWEYIATEQRWDISEWEAGEWHHIAHSWERSVRQETMVDGDSNPDGEYNTQAFVGNGNRPKQDDPYFPDLVTNARYGQIGSFRPEPVAILGGYSVVQDADIERLGNMPEGTIRQINGTVDEFFMSPDPDRHLETRERYPIYAEVTTELGLPIPSGGNVAVQPASVAYTAMVHEDPDDPDRIHPEAPPVSMRAVDDSGREYAIPEAGGPIPDEAYDEETGLLRLRVGLTSRRAGGSSGPQGRVTPILDDVTVHVLVPGRLVESIVE